MSELEQAADDVLRTMRALDAHRQDGAPTLDRAYRRALEAYFVAAERAMGRDASRDAARESDELEDEDLDDVVDSGLREALASVRGHYTAARHALRLARAYRSEPGTSGRRERECVEAALRHREAIRAIRLRLRPPAQQLLLPGLAKTRAPREAGVGGLAAKTG
jgi:hypothetical protein